MFKEPATAPYPKSDKSNPPSHPIPLRSILILSNLSFRCAVLFWINRGTEPQWGMLFSTCQNLSFSRGERSNFYACSLAHSLTHKTQTKSRTVRDKVWGLPPKPIGPNTATIIFKCDEGFDTAPLSYHDSQEKIYAYL
jgi:hypothetical protein